jgi:alpha-beta hydrolase superfamily lysophospholipase
MTSKGYYLSYRQWTLADGMPKGVVFIVHGAAGHSGRYERLAMFLNSKGLDCFAVDHYGHGESPGERCHTDLFTNYVDDLSDFIRYVSQTRPASAGVPRFVLGHSMGSLISVHTAMRPDFGNLMIRGLILLSPSLAAKPEAMTSELKSKSLQSPTAEMNYRNTTKMHKLTHDEALNSAYQADPLVYHGNLRARFTCEVLEATAAADAFASQFQVPFLIMHGTNNLINKPGKGGKGWHDKAASADKTYVAIDGAYHELHNEAEPFQSKFRDALFSWISARLSSPTIAPVYVPQAEAVAAARAAGAAGFGTPFLQEPVAGVFPPETFDQGTIHTGHAGAYYDLPQTQMMAVV